MLRTALSLVAASYVLFAVADAGAFVFPAGKTLAPETVKNIRITDIEVTSRHSSVPPEDVAAVQKHLESKMPKCASGPNPMKLIVRLDNYKGISAGSTILLGGHVQFAGLVKFVEPDGTLAGEYYNEQYRLGGGLFGVAILGDAVSNFAQDFVLEICEEVFGVDLSRDPVPQGDPDTQ